ncbi:MAG: aldehyde dehydrogenase family protein, partial [Gammaproteobacteria bacterium]|nr:aldehyde dehydrogenase family protein [Gammaproteobacteria bacterium]
MPDLIKSMLADSSPRAGTVEVVSPFDLSIIATVETSGPSAVEQALATADRLFRDRSNWLPKHRRIEILEKTAAIMTERMEELALEAAREGGKPLTDSRIEVARATDSIRICVDCLRTEAGETIPMGINAASAGKIAFTSREPIGVVVAVSAFNHPLNLISH